MYNIVHLYLDDLDMYRIFDQLIEHGYGRISHVGKID